MNAVHPIAEELQALANDTPTFKPQGVKPEAELLFNALTPAEFLKIPPITWAVKGVLPDRGLIYIYGPSRSGKTFIVLHLIYCLVVAMCSFFGWKTKPMDCLYIALEGVRGVRNRVQASIIEKSREWPDNVRFVTEPFDLFDDSHVREIIKIAPKGGMIVIDTLSRATPGRDENAPKDMSLMISYASKIQREIDGLVILVAHTGKDTAKGPRGHSSQLAALDAAIEVGRNGDTRFIYIDKVKDGEDGIKKYFRLKPVVIGTDEDGEDTTSCVVEPLDDTAAGKADNPPLSRSLEYALESLDKALEAEGGISIHIDRWRPYFYAGHSADNDEAKKKAFQRARKDLLEREEISVFNDRYSRTGRDK